ncbi:MAG: hypothetical protein WC822_01310 [Candidatus Paceibacterota bacterium]|jgi:hypothetical protein
MVLPPRNKEEAEDLILRYEDYYAKAFAGFEEDDMFYEGQLEHLVSAPDGFPVTIPTTGRAIVDEATDAIVPQDFLINYPPRALTKVGEADSQNNGRFIHNALKHVRKVSADIDPIRDFARNLFRSGKACFKVVPDYTLWPLLGEEEEKRLKAEGGTDKVLERVRLIEKIRAENFPYSVRSLAPQCIMEDPTISGRKLWMCERYTMNNSEVRSLYSVDIPEMRERDFWGYESYLIHELWTMPYVDFKGRYEPGRQFIFVNYECVEEREHGLRRLPYILKYSGYGREAYNAQPELKSVGFFTPQVKSMLLAEARRNTHFDAIMSQFAYPVAFMPESMEDAGLSLEPGAVNYVPDVMMSNVGNMFAKAPIAAPEYLQSLNYIASQIERGSVQRSVRGAPLPGADSAAQYGMQSNAGRLRLDSCQQATEMAVSEMGAMFLYYTDEVLKTTVSVFASEAPVDKYSVSPKTIKGHYVVGVTFQPNEDAIKERKLILANDAINKGGLSPFDALLFAGFDNPVELIGRRMAWDILMSDPIRNHLAKEQLREWGLDADAAELEAAAKDMEKQMALRDMANAMQVGGHDNAPAPEGEPPPGMEMGPPPPSAMQPGQQPGQMPQQGPTGPMGGPGGAPQQQIPAEMAGMMQDLNSLNGGIQP